MTVGIISTGYGNISSVSKMVELSGYGCKLVKSPNDLTADVKKLILPGVGSFDHGMRAIHGADLYHPLMNSVLNNKIPILGICLGMHLLANGSEEGDEKGFGFIQGSVKMISLSESGGLKLPHVGWRWVNKVGMSDILLDNKQKERFYFTHSYVIVPDQDSIITSTVHYGHELCVSIESENVYGVQFHPEKSHVYGHSLIRRFCEL